jgi:hypothetical protein
MATYIDGTDWTRETTQHKAEQDARTLKQLGITSPDVSKYKYKFKPDPRTTFYTNSKERYEYLKEKFSQDIHGLGNGIRDSQPQESTEEDN